MIDIKALLQELLEDVKGSARGIPGCWDVDENDTRAKDAMRETLEKWELISEQPDR